MQYQVTIQLHFLTYLRAKNVNKMSESCESNRKKKKDFSLEQEVMSINYLVNQLSADSF